MEQRTEYGIFDPMLREFPVFHHLFKHAVDSGILRDFRVEITFQSTHADRLDEVYADYPDKLPRF